MDNGEKNMYTAGQMAKLGRVTKATLYFYEKQELLTPTYVGENGYRYYSIDDFFRLDMITVLRFLGASIKEIKALFNNLTTEEYVTVLKEKLHDIEQECMRLETIKSKIASSVYYSELAIKSRPHVICIEEQPQEYILVEPIIRDGDALLLGQSFSMLMEKATRKGFAPDIHVGKMIKREKIDRRDFSPDYFFCTCPADTASNRTLSVKPKGKYMTMIHQGSYDTLDQSYRMILDHIHAHNDITVIGNAYEQPLVGWFNCNSTEKYATKISIAISIEPAGAPVRKSKRKRVRRLPDSTTIPTILSILHCLCAVLP